MRVLVVTDKYPPAVVGGAEISLKLTLDQIPSEAASIHIAVLDQAPDAKPRTDEASGKYPVTRLAGLGQWPPHYPYPGPGEPPLSGLRGRLAWPIAALRYLFTPNGRGFSARWRRLHGFRKLTKAGHIAQMPSFDDDLVLASRARKQLRAMIRKVKPDVVHADNSRSILVSAATKRRSSLLASMVRDNRFLCSRRDQNTNIHGRICGSCALECLAQDPDDLRVAKHQIMTDVMTYRRASLAESDHLITTSAYLEHQINELMPGTPIQRVPNPAIQDSEPQASGAQTSDVPEVLVVGMLNENKGQARVVQWIQHLNEHFGRVRIVLAGRGQLGGRLDREASEAGVRDQLELPGFLDRESLRDAYDSAHVVLIPSVWPEPFGRVPLEAGLAARPVVSYAVGGLSESIIHGTTGYIVPPGDEAGLLSRVRDLLLDPEAAKRMGEAAKAHITQTYAPEFSATALVNAWRTAMERAA